MHKRITALGAGILAAGTVTHAAVVLAGDQLVNWSGDELAAPLPALTGVAAGLPDEELSLRFGTSTPEARSAPASLAPRVQVAWSFADAASPVQGAESSLSIGGGGRLADEDFQPWTLASSGRRRGSPTLANVVPEPQHFALAVGLGALGYGVWRRLRH